MDIREGRCLFRSGGYILLWYSVYSTWIYARVTVSAAVAAVIYCNTVYTLYENMVLWKGLSLCYSATVAAGSGCNTNPDFVTIKLNETLELLYIQSGYNIYLCICTAAHICIFYVLSCWNQTERNVLIAFFLTTRDSILYLRVMPWCVFYEELQLFISQKIVLSNPKSSLRLWTVQKSGLFIEHIKWLNCCFCYRLLPPPRNSLLILSRVKIECRRILRPFL